ncbi:MecA-like transpeptidase family protein [Saccharothrix saharensis]|uniref:MecA-like transpeptidase family protein n=1 Tax=Saccharothrix saharensis TaxID=571190 RepID=A0A543JN72_9PSEU|nr:penicillin-binding transpeptidase domain-containing protein [Saccharothrix saharensis]TQM84279.1 MecA-like transpeptidase family protein [Saccharothrix saharensis]
MNKRSKRWVLATGGAAAVAVIVAGVVVLSSGGGPAAEKKPERVAPGVVAQQFFTAVMSGQAGQAAAVTDAAGAAGAALARTQQAVPGVSFHAQLGRLPQVAEGATTAGVDADVTWTLPGGVPVKYATKVELRLVDDQWRVHWSPSLLHPQLVEGQSLAYTTTSAEGSLVDRTGRVVPADFAPVVMGSVRQAAGSLNGTPGWRFAIVDQAGAPVTVLQEQKAQAVKSLTVTLDPKTQAAAQAAVDQVAGEAAMLVAIQPSTGEILAVAQNATAGHDPLALYGRYEPGSTFKIVTATAAMTSGLATADTPVPCPGKATIGTRQITNDDSFELGTVPLHRAFAASCNTSFSQLAADMSPTALPEAAAYFGLASDFTVPGITTNTGKIPPADSVPARVEAGIGQGRMQATPFGMALVAATVANGRTPVPQLIREMPTEGAAPTALPGGVAGALRSMMGEVVTGGTARELARYGAVRGKTGTAQFGDGTRSHGWFVGYRGDLAFSVLVVNGGSSKVAVAATGTFLGAL